MSADEENNVFYFESDHVALRGNQDYSTVLRTLAILEAQKVRVHKQLEELTAAKQRYMQNPELLLDELRNNKEILKTTALSIPEVPQIVGTYKNLHPEIKKEEESSSFNTPPVVRGRLVDESKSHTFNQLWSCEEQQRLEELLIEYPAEPIEQRRYVKIAKALGNRTPQQVASRVQKYFLKLHNAGMPIPGRKPKTRRIVNTKNKFLYKPTTFFPKHNVSVHMPEQDMLTLDLLNFNASAMEQETEANTSVNNSKIDEKQRKLEMLKIIRDEKQNMSDSKLDLFYEKCDICLVAPQMKTRWRCITCYTYLNQCTDCLASQLMSNNFEHLRHDIVNETK